MLLCSAAIVSADTAPADQAQVTVTVLDQTGAALVIASVTLVDPAGTPVTRQVDARGEVTFEHLAPGSYQLKADAAAFQSFDGPLKVKKGANQLTLKLPLAGLNEQVIVTTQDSDVRGNGFVTQLSEQEIAELPDDPDELQQVLEQMAGPGATFRVNGFTGGRLPPKSQIRQIRFRMNSFDAEYHEGGGFGIDIITKPGMDGWKGMTNFGFRDESLNARNAFAPTLGAEQHRRFGFNADGPIVKGKTSMAISLEGNDWYDSETINALTPDGRVEGSIRNPEKRMFGSVRLDHSISKNQQMLVEFQRNNDDRDNLGVGDFDLPDRAYSREITNNALRIGLNGLIAPKVAHELRVRFESGTTSTSSLSSDPAIIVLDNFSTGGAGQNGNRRNKTFEVADNIDWTVGKKHAFRAGVLAQQYWYNSSDLTNFNGTFTFGGLQQYELGLPTTFTQRTGSADVDYTFFEFGWFVQDTWTLSKKLSVSLGLRQEMQSHLDDKNNLMPRLGATWAPGKFTVRGGYGIFYDWYESNYYEQVLRVNGVTQQETVIRFPGYPDPTGGQIADPLPPSRIVEAAGLSMPYVHQASIGIERTFIETLRIQATYLMQRGRDQFRSVNINAPLDGVRPDDSLGNVTELRSNGTADGRSPDGERELRNPAEAVLHGRQLPVRAGEELHRQPVLAAGRQLRSRCRVGAVHAGHPAPVLRDGELRPAEEHADGAVHAGQFRGALQHHHGLRRERRHADQRSPRRRDEKHGARRGAVECESAAEQDVQFRAAGDVGRPSRDSRRRWWRRARRAGRPRWRRRSDDDGDGREHAALSHGVLRAGVQPAEPHEFSELRRQRAIALLRDGDLRQRRAADRGRDQFRILTFDCSCGGGASAPPFTSALAARDSARSDRRG